MSGLWGPGRVLQQSQHTALGGTPCVFLGAALSICVSCLSSVCIYVCLSECLSVCLSMCISECLWVRPSADELAYNPKGGVIDTMLLFTHNNILVPCCKIRIGYNGIINIDVA